MTALLLHLLPYIAGVFAVTLVGWKLRQSGVNAERARQMNEKLVAAEDRLQMDREAAAIEQGVSSMSDGEARKEAMRWSRS